MQNSSAVEKLIVLVSKNGGDFSLNVEETMPRSEEIAILGVSRSNFYV